MGFYLSNKGYKPELRAYIAFNCNLIYSDSMLTKSDLKAIDDLLDKRFESQFSDFEKRQDKKLGQRFSDFENRIDKKMDAKLKPIHQQLRKISKDIDVIISSFDREYLELRGRIERIEQYLKLPRLFE